MSAEMRGLFDFDIMKDVGAVVLGGGRGTRLYPLTKVRAKPAVPLAGRYRLVDIPMSNCIHSGINRMVILTQFNSHSLNRHINNTYRFDNFSGGYVEVLSAEQTDQAGVDWFQGTADAVRKQLLHISDLRAKYYIILSGDQLYRMDYRTLMATHLRKKADATVATLPVSAKDAEAFGIMKVAKNGRIHQFTEKPKDPAVLKEYETPQEAFDSFALDGTGKPHLASMGVYIFNAEFLEHLLEAHPQWVDFGKELLPRSLKSHKIYAHMFDGFWEDIGTVRNYFDVSMEMTSEDPPFEFHDENHLIFTHRRALPGVKVSDANIKNAIICGGTRIDKATISNSIVGIRSIVQPGAEIDRTVVLGSEYFEADQPEGSLPIGIGEGARISNAIIDHNARIGKDVVIRGDKSLEDYECDDYCIRDGIVIILKNAVIPDHTVIG